MPAPGGHSRNASCSTRTVCSRCGTSSGGQRAVAQRSDFVVHAGLQLGVAAQRPQRVTQRRRCGVVPGEHEKHQLIADFVVGQLPAGVRVTRLDERAHQRRVPIGIGAHGGEDLGAQPMQAGIGRLGPALATGGHPLREVDRPDRPIGNPGQRGTQRGAHLIGPLVEIDAEHRPAQRPQRECPARDIQIDGRTVAPAVRDRVRRGGHVPRVLRDVPLGEHRLQRAPARQPALMRQIQQVAAHQPAQFDHVDGGAAIGDRIAATQDIPGALRGGDQQHRGDQPPGAQYHSADGASGVAEPLMPLDEGPHRLDRLSVGQGIARCERQGGCGGPRIDLDHASSVDHAVRAA